MNELCTRVVYMGPDRPSTDAYAMPGSFQLTIGKEYELLLWKNSNAHTIIDDGGDSRTITEVLIHDYFKPLHEIRDTKLNELGIIKQK